MLSTILLIFHLIISVLLIGLVLIQKEGGSSMMPTGGGVSKTVFGSRGVTPFMAKFTAWMICLFFINGLALGMFYPNQYLLGTESLGKPSEFQTQSNSKV